MVKARTLAQVNAAIRAAGFHETLVKDRAGQYFYFIDLGDKRVPGESIPVSRVGVYTVEQWVDELKEARGKL
jgi:hypothetical protein